MTKVYVHTYILVSRYCFHNLDFVHPKIFTNKNYEGDMRNAGGGLKCRFCLSVAFS